jgi:hypothetical protein
MVLSLDGTTSVSVWLKRDRINPFFVWYRTVKEGSPNDKWGPSLVFSFSSSQIGLSA